MKSNKIYDNPYIHYINKYTNGTVLVDLRISVFYKDEGYIYNNNKVDEWIYEYW